MTSPGILFGVPIVPKKGNAPQTPAGFSPPPVPLRGMRPLWAGQAKSVVPPLTAIMFAEASGHTLSQKGIRFNPLFLLVFYVFSATVRKDRSPRRRLRHSR